MKYIRKGFMVLSLVVISILFLMTYTVMAGVRDNLPKNAMPIFSISEILTDVPSNCDNGKGRFQGQKTATIGYMNRAELVSGRYKETRYWKIALGERQAPIRTKKDKDDGEWVLEPDEILVFLPFRISEEWKNSQALVAVKGICNRKRRKIGGYVVWEYPFIVAKEMEAKYVLPRKEKKKE